MAQPAPVERISERTQIVDVSVPQVAKETVEAVREVQREHMQQRTVDAPTPQELKETVEMVRSVLHERVQQRDAEQIEGAASIFERDRRDGEVGLTCTSATARRRTDLPVLEVLDDLAECGEKAWLAGRRAFPSSCLPQFCVNSWMVKNG